MLSSKIFLENKKATCVRDVIKISQLVSALINNYNYGRFIGEAIESVLNQTYQNIELIIVDDGSTDNSQDIISKYVKQYPGKITAVFKENGGQASAFNSGFEIARGEIVCFLDSDDYWFPNKIERIVEAHKEADIVEHSMLNTGDSCRLVPMKTNAQSLMKEKGKFQRFSETSTLSFSKKILSEIFPIPEKGLEICSETYVVYGALYFTPKVKTLREVLSYYRIHGKNYWYDNDNADRNNFTKIINLLNESLLQKGIEPILFGRERASKVVNEIVLEKNKKYGIYGTGSVSQELYEKLNKENIEISFYIDSYAENEFEKYNGRKIIPVANINNHRDKYDYIIIGSSFRTPILNALLTNGVEMSRIILLDL